MKRTPWAHGATRKTLLCAGKLDPRGKPGFPGWKNARRKSSITRQAMTMMIMRTKSLPYERIRADHDNDSADELTAISVTG